MAESRNNKKMRLSIELPECPVCHQTLSAPIYLCESGHSVCNSCIANLKPPVCPRCRKPITKIRSRQLEDLIARATTNCPNKESGCSYKSRSDLMEDHVNECVYRVMKCPLYSLVQCYWKGEHRKMVDHFKECHPQNILMNLDEVVNINNITVSQDGRFVYIVPEGIIIYILTLQFNVL